MGLRVLAVLFCLTGWAAQAQSLRELNFNYIYNPDREFSFLWRITRQADSFDVHYQLQVTDTSQLLQSYSIQWELRNSLSDKNGTPVTAAPQVVEERSWKQMARLRIPLNNPAPNLLVARVTNASKKKEWVFHKTLPLKQSPYLAGDGAIVHSFLSKGQSVTLRGFENEKPLLISWYNDPFPSAAPPFSTTQSKVSKTIKPDSIYTMASDGLVQFDKKGLYLAQHDTASAEGLAFRVEEDYPKLGKLESLAGPLIYVCTKQEFEKVQLAGSDKKKFDQIILSMTGTAERARIFMRNYFKRVELANLYFTSYKEGWKTDRGMIYIIFGLPDEVYLFDNHEVWEYKTGNTKLRFQFVKSQTVFDPENFVLIREKKFTDPYYQRVDLWRKARF